MFLLPRGKSILVPLAVTLAAQGLSGVGSHPRRALPLRAPCMASVVMDRPGFFSKLVLVRKEMRVKIDENTCHFLGFYV